MNKVPTSANIHVALKNNEISSHLEELPKAINKKKNRTYCIFQKLQNVNFCCKTTLGSFNVKQTQLPLILSLPGESLTIFCPEKENCILFLSLPFPKKPSEVQWPQQQDSQALQRWGSLLRGALRDLWTQTEREGLCNLNRIVSMPLWIEFLQSWCKIRGHTQSHAGCLVKRLWLNGDEVAAAAQRKVCHSHWKATCWM